ncbi:hypothetical protein QRE66_08790 [Bacillus cereus]|nr:hypothetical protein QRE66_08790 [Bacillus cereus]
MECKHKWIDMEDGTNDQFCIKCSMKQKQAMMVSDIGLNLGVNIAVGIRQPVARETMTVQSYGCLHEVDKEQWMKAFNKSLCIGIDGV